MQFEFRQGPSYGRTRDQNPNRTIGGFNPAHLSESRGFDGKRVRKAIQRRTIDYNSVIIRHLQHRVLPPLPWNHAAVQPQPSFVVNYLPPFSYPHNPVQSVTTKFIHTSTNKVRCPINAVRVLCLT